MTTDEFKIAIASHCHKIVSLVNSRRFKSCAQLRENCLFFAFFRNEKKVHGMHTIFVWSNARCQSSYEEHQQCKKNGKYFGTFLSDPLSMPSICACVEPNYRKLVSCLIFRKEIIRNFLYHFSQSQQLSISLAQQNYGTSVFHLKSVFALCPPLFLSSAAQANDLLKYYISTFQSMKCYSKWLYFCFVSFLCFVCFCF